MGPVFLHTPALVHEPTNLRRCQLLLTCTTRLTWPGLAWLQVDPVQVLTNQTALDEFSSKLQNQMAGFFGVPPIQASIPPGAGWEVGMSPGAG